MRRKTEETENFDFEAQKKSKKCKKNKKIRQ